MAKVKLTKRTIDALRARDREYVIWDAVLPGYGVRVKPSGVIAFVIQYRNAGNRSRRLTIGRYGVWTPDAARKEARRLLVDIQAGDDPAAVRHADRRAATITALCDRYLGEHVDVHNAPTTQREVRRMVEKHIKPKLGALTAKDLTRQDVMKLHLAMRNTPREANHVLSVLSKMLTLAEHWAVRPDGSNPCRTIRRYPEVKRERFLDDDELTRLGAALDQAEHDGQAHPDAIRAIWLLALSGCRMSEVLGLQWDHVAFEAGALYLPDAKTGSRHHTIGARALAVLADIARVDGSDYVFHGRDGDGPLSVGALQYAWRHVRAAARLEGVRLHDLRHTVGTYAGQSGANAFLVRDKLGHKTLEMTGRYVSQSIEPLRALSDTVERRIQSAMTAHRRGDAASRVVPLRRS
jgi:integrase